MSSSSSRSARARGQAVGRSRRRFVDRAADHPAGDVSAYISINVISITDGQIYLEADRLLGDLFRRSTSVCRCRASAVLRNQLTRNIAGTQASLLQHPARRACSSRSTSTRPRASSSPPCNVGRSVEARPDLAAPPVRTNHSKYQAATPKNPETNGTHIRRYPVKEVPRYMRELSEFLQAQARRRRCT